MAFYTLIEVMANPEIPSWNPFYLHSYKNPSIVLVKPPLIGNNYHSWCQAMKMALLSKNKLGFIDGSLSVPDEIDRRYAIW